MKPLSVVPNFPKRAYLAALFLKTSGQRLHLLPLERLFLKVEMIQEYFMELKDSASVNEYSVTDSVIICPVKLDRIVPLKEEYWEKPTIKYDLLSRMDLFSQLFSFYQLYYLLVTPASVAEKVHLLSAAVPFKKDGFERDLELFMRLTDFPVDKRAKYAALYSIEEPIGFDFERNRVVRSSAEILSRPSGNS